MAAEVASSRPSPPPDDTLDDANSLPNVHDIDAETDNPPPLEIAVSFAGQTHVFQLPADAVLDDLTIACEDLWDRKDGGGSGDSGDSTAPTAHDWSAHKFIAPPPVGLIKGAADHDRPLAPLVAALTAAAKQKNKNQTASPPAITLRLLASRLSDLNALRAASESVRRREERRRDQLRRQRAGPKARTTRPGFLPSSSQSSPSSPYIFQRLQALTHMPHADRSLAFLQRLRDDVGVRAVMQVHRFTVGLLTEMDPAMHTTATHEGTTRTLGLNRNGGAVIELRLRTDAGDGYRDYRTVRRTLCHELAHNVHSEHDASFWALYRQLEREVERADYHGSGRTLAGDHSTAADYYRPIHNSAEEEDEPVSDDEYTDAGGWTGGSFVLGSGAVAAAPTASTTESPNPSANTAGASRRDLAARAAEERMKRTAEERQRGNGSGR